MFSDIMWGTPIADLTSQGYPPPTARGLMAAPGKGLGGPLQCSALASSDGISCNTVLPLMPHVMS